MTLFEASGALFIAVLVLFVVLLWRLSWLLVWLTRTAVVGLLRWLMGSRTWARTHSLDTLMMRRLPSTYGFVRGRLDPRRFSGLPLTLLTIAASYLVLLFIGLVEEIMEAEEITSFDDTVNALFKPYRTVPLVRTFAWITDLGNTATLASVTVVATGLLWASGRTAFVIPLWVTIVGAHATTWLGKFGFDRERPEFVTAASAFSPSFPSAHAAGSMAVYGFVAYAIARELQSLRQRFEIAYWTATTVALIGFSRIFLSVHHASDVGAGFLIGGFWLLVGFVIFEHS